MCVLWAQMQFYDIHAYEGECFSFVYSRGKIPSTVIDLMW